MRTYKFRGRHPNLFEWFVGGLVTHNVYTGSKKTWTIIDDNEGVFVIDPRTVGQYTGCEDAKAVEIYEGDIISINIDGESHIFVIEYDELGARYIGVERHSDGSWLRNLYSGDMESTEVIGNIYENPELLG